MDAELQALQQEAMRRLADVLSDVQDQLAATERAIMATFFTETDPEPVFVFRAQDKGAMSAIATYYSWCLINGLTEHGAEVQKAMHEMRDWQTRNPDRMKYPDHKHKPVSEEIQKAYAALVPEGISRPAPGDPIRGERMADPFMPSYPPHA